MTTAITFAIAIVLTTSKAADVYPTDAYGPVEQRRCFRPTRIEIPECQNRFYNFTAFPNLVGQESQLDARHQLQTFKPLITYKCSNHLAFFLCSVYAPMCDVNTNHLIGPCRPMCERVRKRCSPVLKIFNFDWPSNLNCSRFPERNSVGGTMCMEGPDIPEDFGEEFQPPGDVEQAQNKQKLPPAKSHHTPPLVVESSPPENDLVNRDTKEFIRELDELPNNAGHGEIAKLGRHLQTWLSRLNQNPLPAILGTDDVPIALLVSSIRHCSHLAKPTFYVFINRTGRCAPHCTADLLFSPSAKTLAAVWTSVISGLCLLATTYTLLSYAICPSLFHPLERPVIYIAGCQLAYGLGFALRLKLGRESVTCGKDPASGYDIRLQEGLDNVNCAIVFLIQYYFFTAGALWWTMLVIGWATRSAYHLRLAKLPAKPIPTSCRTIGSDNYSLVKDGCCLVDFGRGMNEQRRSGQSTKKQCHPPTRDAGSSFLRFSQFNRRVNRNTGSGADVKCLAKEHVIAWLTPGLLTVGVLVSRQVDADELLGICSVGRQNTKAMLIFMLVPQLVFFLTGIVAFFLCVVYLIKLKRALRQRHIIQTSKMANLDSQLRYLACQSDQQSEIDTTFANSCTSGDIESTNCCCNFFCGPLRWDNLSTRLGFFCLLYVVPVVSVLVCDFYEFWNRDKWLAGEPSSAVARILSGSATDKSSEVATPEIFLLRTFMSLVTGFATCLWLLTIKGIESWRRLARQIGSRGFLCFSAQQQQPSMAPIGAASLSPMCQYAKTNQSNASTVLHPYAVYQHGCSATKSITDDRYGLSIRPPAGPGVDAGEKCFMQPAGGGMSLPSPNQASGYYSSATTNNSVGSGSCVPPCPPPNTPPGTIRGDSNPGSSAAGGWWEPLGGSGSRHAAQNRCSSSSAGGRHPEL